MHLTSLTGSPWLAWYHALDRRGRRAFFAAFAGFGMDAYDFWLLPLGIGAMGFSDRQATTLNSVTLVVSALGGALSGALVDRIGRARTLQLTVIAYAVCTCLCGLAPNFETLLFFRGLQGLGFGGEWAAGAVLVSEYATPRYRGTTLGVVQSSWAVGWALAVLASTVIFSLVPAHLAWRLLFLTGALPALFIIWLRRNVRDADVAVTSREQRRRGSYFGIFSRALRVRTLLAALLATGVQGGYYTLAIWLPKYLKDTRNLTVLGAGAHLAAPISGAFVGYLVGGHLADRLGRKKSFLLFSVLSAALIVAYTRIPSSANAFALVLGFPLGFSMSAIFSGFGSYLAELYPTDLRGTGQGFTYNVGRAAGAAFPLVVGLLGAGGALALGAVGYGLAALSLAGLPETRGRDLS